MSSSADLPTALRDPQPRNVQLLLDSRLPARMAWVGGDGQPYVAAMWFRWTGTELEMSTFQGAKKLEDLRDGVSVEVLIDTDVFPYRSVKMAGPITLEEHDGITQSYQQSATRYLGEEAGREWCASLEGATQVLIRLTPTTASSSDMSSAPFLSESAGTH